MIRVAPSILAADFTALGAEARAVEAGGADWLHLDVMDGQFVPNLTFGPPIIAALRRATSLPFDVHLMVERPEALIPATVEAGAQWITVHVETCPHLNRTLNWLRALGVHPGVSLNPGTPLSAIEEVIPCIDQVLVMTVNPGFGGQRLIPNAVEKVRRCREMLTTAGSQAELSVDGGVTVETIGSLVGAGATVVVAGSSIFGHSSGPAAGISELRAAAEQLR